MAYHGYIQSNKIVEHCSSFKAPFILEIGVSSGISALSLIHQLDKLHDEFGYMGVDIHIQKNVKYTLDVMNLKKAVQTYLIEGNSLVVLPDLVKKGLKFDLILLDGDHNYFTVEQELKYIINLMHRDTMLICDDYDGRWSEVDLFYSSRSETRKGKDATEVKETEKSGVKPAVDEFLDEHPELMMGKLLEGEPVVIFHKDSKLAPFEPAQIIR